MTIEQLEKELNEKHPVLKETKGLDILKELPKDMLEIIEGRMITLFNKSLKEVIEDTKDGEYITLIERDNSLYLDVFYKQKWGFFSEQL